MTRSQNRSQKGTSRRDCQYCGRTNASNWLPVRKETGRVTRWHPDIRNGACRRCRGDYPFTPDITARRALRWLDANEERLREEAGPQSVKALRMQAHETQTAADARELREDLRFLSRSLQETAPADRS